MDCENNRQKVEIGVWGYPGGPEWKNDGYP